MLNLRGMKEAIQAKNSEDMSRITSAQIYEPFHKKPQAKEYEQTLILPKAEITELTTAQVDAVSTYARVGGLFGSIGVGHGKTLITLAIANLAYHKGLRKIILLIPASVSRQLTTRDIKWLRKQTPLNFPVHVIAGKAKKKRTDLSNEDRGLFIMAYSQLSLQDTDDILNNISPELIIADEGHELSNSASTRTRRVKRYIDENPDTEFCVMSGTLYKKEISRIHHLMKWALKDNCPLPVNMSDLATWASALDTSYSEYTDDTTLEPIRSWARNNFDPKEFPNTITGYRKAVNKRFETTLGIVSTGDATIATSLAISNTRVEGASEELEQHFKQLDDFMVAPNGDEIEHAIHKFKWKYELSAGFYNNLVWAEPEVYAKRKGISLEESIDQLDRAKEHHSAHQMYAKALRDWIRDYATPGLDTPLQIGLEMYHHGADKVGSELHDTWCYMKALEFEDMPTRDRFPVRVCDYKVQASLDWAESLPKKEGKIIWFYNTAMGVWLNEEAEKRGLNPVFAHAGKKGTERILNEDNRDRLIIASITAHGTGLNLQSYQHMYWIQTPRAAHQCEQLIGRNHRTGQTADSLTINTCHSNEFDDAMFSSTLADAMFAHSIANKQKLIYATYDPIPTVFPSMVLKEQGIITKDFDSEVEHKLTERFNLKKKLKNKE